MKNKYIDVLYRLRQTKIIDRKLDHKIKKFFRGLGFELNSFGYTSETSTRHLRFIVKE